VELSQALARHATLAVQLTRLAEQEQQAAVLRERNRMAREIHDALAQGFTGIVLQLDAAEYALTKSPAAARNHLDQARALARESLVEARRSVWALRARALETRRLPDALSDLVGRMSSAGASVTPQFRVHGMPRELPPHVEEQLLRIASEALTNALKHSQARMVHLDLIYQPGQVEISVQDDGRGFIPSEPEGTDSSTDSSEGFGLIGMKERAELIRATLVLATQPGQGTTVSVVVPIGDQQDTARK
jgi:signal transduction histidine kinase